MSGAVPVLHAAAPGSHIPGWMTDQELRWLYSTAARMQSVCEVGCWKGRSTYALCASECPKVYAVDHFQGDAGTGPAGSVALAHFALNLAEFIGKLHVVMAASVDGARMVPDVDMVFLDASHDYESVRQDLEAWDSKAKVLLSGHDFYAGAGVRQAVLERFSRDEVFLCGDIWYVEKKR